MINLKNELIKARPLLLRKIALVGIFLLSSLQTFADEGVEMADTMRANGKIWVVVAVVAIILVGIFVYLLMMGNKIKKLERLIEEKEQVD